MQDAVRALAGLANMSPQSPGTPGRLVIAETPPSQSATPNIDEAMTYIKTNKAPIRESMRFVTDPVIGAFLNNFRQQGVEITQGRIMESVRNYMATLRDIPLTEPARAPKARGQPIPRNRPQVEVSARGRGKRGAAVGMRRMLPRASKDPERVLYNTLETDEENTPPRTNLLTTYDYPTEMEEDEEEGFDFDECMQDIRHAMDVLTPSFFGPKN